MKLIIELDDNIVKRIRKHVYNSKDKVTINDIPPLPVVYTICKAISEGQLLRNGDKPIIKKTKMKKRNNFGDAVRIKEESKHRIKLTF